MFALIVYSLQVVLLHIALSDAVLRAVQIKSRRNPLCSPFFSTRKTSFTVSAKAEKKMVVTDGMFERQSEIDILSDATSSSPDTMNFFKSEPFHSKTKGKLDGTVFEREINESTYSILEDTPKKYIDSDLFADKSDENKPTGLAIVSKGKRAKVKEAKEVQKTNDSSSTSEETYSDVKDNDTIIIPEVVEEVVLLKSVSNESEAEEKTVKVEKSKKRKEVIDEVITEDISEIFPLNNLNQSKSVDSKEVEVESQIVSEESDSVKESQIASENNGVYKVKDSKIAKLMEKIATVVDSAEPFAFKLSLQSDQLDQIKPEIKYLVPDSSNESAGEVIVIEQNDEKLISSSSSSSSSSIKSKKTVENFDSFSQNEIIVVTDEDEEIAKVKMFGGEYCDPFMHEIYPQDLDLLGDLKFDEKILQNSHNMNIYYDDNSEEGMRSVYEKENDAVEEISGGKRKSKSSRSSSSSSSNSPKSEGGRSDAVSDKNMHVILLQLEEKILSLADELYDEKRRSIQLIEAFLKMEVEQDLLRAEFQQYKQLVLEISGNKEVGP